MNEKHSMQLAGISTAAMGYWKEGDSIHPDYDTVALRDVANLYSKYDELFKKDKDSEELFTSILLLWQQWDRGDTICADDAMVMMRPFMERLAASPAKNNKESE